MFFRKKKPRHLTPDERHALVQFACCEINLESLIARLGGLIEIHFEPKERRLTSHFLTPIPGIQIDVGHIQNAISRARHHEISSTDLQNWATMILLNDAYEWEGPDADKIADRLNKLSMPLIFLPPSKAPSS